MRPYGFQDRPLHPLGYCPLFRKNRNNDGQCTNTGQLGHDVPFIHFSFPLSIIIIAYRALHCPLKIQKISKFSWCFGTFPCHHTWYKGATPFLLDDMQPCVISPHTPLLLRRTGNCHVLNTTIHSEWRTFHLFSHSNLHTILPPPKQIVNLVPETGLEPASN